MWGILSPRHPWSYIRFLPIKGGLPLMCETSCTRRLVLDRLWLDWQIQRFAIWLLLPDKCFHAHSQMWVKPDEDSSFHRIFLWEGPCVLLKLNMSGITNKDGKRSKTEIKSSRGENDPVRLYVTLREEATRIYVSIFDVWRGDAGWDGTSAGRD